jgi:hypothetical protein
MFYLLDPKGCEAPALGTYDGELKRSKWIHLGFTLPVSQKQVTLVAGNVRETEKRAALCPKRHRSHKSTPLLEKTNR